MGSTRNDSEVSAPPSTGASRLVTLEQLTALIGGKVTLGSLYRDMRGVWPAVDATNGPLTADGGITATAPTGLQYVGWAANKFNRQSQNWQIVPASNGPAANQCVQNTTTNRGNNYANTGLGFPCHMDFSFVVDTTRLVIAYWMTTTHAANQSVFTSNHEVQVFAEHEGRMKGIRDVPAMWPSGSGGNQMYYRSITFKEAKSREFRVMMSAGCWLAGVYVDTGAQLVPAPNRPVLMACFGDSWAEGAGNVWGGANGNNYGVTWPTGCSLLYSNSAIQYAIATGFAVIIMHQGGTGYFGNLNSGISEDDTTQLGFTVFGSQNSTDFLWSKFGSRFPAVGFFGGWNDPPSYTTAQYQARADKVYRKQFGYRSDCPILVEGIQNKTVTQNDGRDQANTGLKQAVAQLKSQGFNMLGFVDNLADSSYADVGSSAGGNLGPDGLHETVKGGYMVGTQRAKRSANFEIPAAWVAATLTAPIQQAVTV